MVQLSDEERALLEALVVEQGEQKLQQYIDQTFRPTLIAARNLCQANAHTWINVNAYIDWLIADCQSSASTTTTPSTSSTVVRNHASLSRTSTSQSVHTPATAPGALLHSRSPTIQGLGRPVRTPHIPPSSDHLFYDVHIQALVGGQSTFSVTRQTTVSQLKVMIYDRQGIYPDRQRLIFSGRQLEDGETMGVRNIGPGNSTIYLVERLRGN